MNIGIFMDIGTYRGVNKFATWRLSQDRIDILRIGEQEQLATGLLINLM
jgi:hypothetical protein